MSDQKLRSYFLLILLGGSLALAFFIFLPFLYAIVLAAVFATVLQPVYRRLLESFRGRKGLAAFFTIIMVIAFILLPLTLVGLQIFTEARQLYAALLGGGGKDAVLGMVKDLILHLENYFPTSEGITFNFDTYLRQGLEWFVGHLGAIFAGFAKTLLGVFVFLITLYYFLKDSEKLRTEIIKLSPLSDSDDEAVLIKLARSINSIVRGNLSVALIQGILTSIGFTIFGIPNAVLWGSVASLSALIPGVGTSLVLIPAIAFLFISGKTLAGIGLVVWALCGVGLVDNFLGPMLVGRGLHLHPLLILMSVLGGIIFFGPIGFILGPLVLSLLFALIGIYSSPAIK